jgi:hypothetical protein
MSGADFAQQRQAVHRTHAQVGHHHVEGLAPSSVSAAGPPSRRIGIVAGGFQRDLQRVAQGFVVLDDQNAQFF